MGSPLLYCGYLGEELFSPPATGTRKVSEVLWSILDYGGSKEIATLSSKARNDNQNLLVIALTSSGKTFIGEMAAVTQAIHNKKTIYLVPLKTLDEEKYRRFKKMYNLRSRSSVFRHF